MTSHPSLGWLACRILMNSDGSFRISDIIPGSFAETKNASRARAANHLNCPLGGLFARGVKVLPASATFTITMENPK